MPIPVANIQDVSEGTYDGSEWLKFQPIGMHGANRLYCADGFVVCRAGDQCLGYTLVTRGGAVEATAANLFMTYKPNDQSLINAKMLRDDVRDAVVAYLAGLIELGASGPWIVCLTLFNCQSARIVVTTQSAWEHERLGGLPIADEPFVFPSALVEHKHSTPSEASEALRPIFDALWQAGGKGRM
jgi:hypothetical protein